VTNIFDGGVNDLRDFVNAVTELAINDHKFKPNVRRSGSEITGLTTDQCRIFHQRMATGIYNNARATLRLMDDQRS
jgi:hypothetical protein